MFDEFEDGKTVENETSGDPSLTSILAEVKGSAFINGEQKLPPDLLEERAARIMREADAMSKPATPKPSSPNLSQINIGDTSHATDSIGDNSYSTNNFKEESYPTEHFYPTNETPSSFGSELQSARVRASDSDLGARSSNVFSATIADEQDEASVEFFDFEQATKSDSMRSEWNEPAGSDDYSADEDIFVEPSLKLAASKFAVSCNSISIRLLPASAICVLMILITYVFESGRLMPFGIGYSLAATSATLIFLLLVVMLLCSDIIVRGVDFLKRGAPNVESLILFSCVFSIISALFTILSDTAQMLPFCTVSAITLTLAGFGEKYNLRAFTETLKTTLETKEPFGVQAEHNTDIDKTVLKKKHNTTEGFYTSLIQPDIAEILFKFAAPVLLILSLVLTIITVLVRGEPQHSLHILSAMLAAAAPFSALLSFAIPFMIIARAARKSGSAIAGWCGADEIWATDGVCITDDDLFPPGMLKLTSVKVYDGASSEIAIRYTSNIIIRSGSGLSGLFAEVLRQQGISTMKVKDFVCHESGIEGIINSDKVCVGSAAFMNLQGVRVPDEANIKNALFTSINGRLTAMFAIDYKPLPSVQSALIDMMKWRIDLFFAMRDFNVTPAMVGQKFKVPFDSFVFIPTKDSYAISDLYSQRDGMLVSVLARDGLGPYSQTVTGGRLLRSASFLATILSVASALVGVLIMFFMTLTGAFSSASPGNLIIFMLCMLASVLIVCGYVKLKK